MSGWRSVVSGRRVRTMARWATGVAILLALVIGLDSSALAAELASTNLLLAAVGIAGLTAAHTLGAATWRALCRRTAGLRLPWSMALSWYYAGQALGGVTPGNLGGDAYRIYTMRSAGNGFDASVAPVVIQRATSYLALSAIGGTALAFLASSSRVSALVVIPAAAVALLGAVIAGLLLVAPGPLRGVESLLIRLLGARGADGASDARGWRGRIMGAAGIGLAMGMAFHLGSVLLTYLLVLAVEPGPPSVSALAAVAVARLSLAIPISPSGLGFQEGALSVLFLGIGMAPETALAALLLGRLSLLTTTAIGASALALGRGGGGRPVSGVAHPTRGT